MKLDKWIIDSRGDSIGEFSKKSLMIRLEDVKEKIEKYLEKPTEEKLHQIRISIRRLRYSIEVFFVCFQKKKYSKFYMEIKKIQDETGKIRDLDIIKKILKDKSAIKDINKKRRKLEKGIIKDLEKFLKSEIYSDFLEMINFKNIDEESKKLLSNHFLEEKKIINHNLDEIKDQSKDFSLYMPYQLRSFSKLFSSEMSYPSLTFEYDDSNEIEAGYYDFKLENVIFQDCWVEPKVIKENVITYETGSYRFIIMKDEKK